VIARVVLAFEQLQEPISSTELQARYVTSKFFLVGIPLVSWFLLVLS